MRTAGVLKREGGCFKSVGEGGVDSVLRPDFTSLRIYLAVYVSGNIARAAARENIAPSAISKRIQDLEADAGVPLFHRHARGVTATAAGEALARHARSLFDVLNGMSAELSGFSDGARGDVRIHAHSSAVVQYLPTEIASFTRAWPGIRVVLREEISPSVIASVQDGGADIGIFADNMGALPGLTLMPYRLDRLGVLLPRTHPMAGAAEVGFASICEGEFISPESGSSLQILLKTAARDMGFPLRLTIEVKTFEAAVRMAEAGLGIAVLPLGIASAFAGTTQGGLAAVPLSDSWAHRRLVMCMRDESRLAASARLMLEHLRAGAARAASATTAAVPNG